MAKIKKDEVKKIAELARIKLTAEEIEKYTSQFESIFGYMEILNEVDTEGVESTSQVTGLQDVMRDDTVDRDFCSGDELLECSPLEVEDRQIKVRKVL